MLQALQLWPPCLHSSQQNMYRTPQTKQKHPPQHPRFVGGPHVVQLGGFLRFSKICQPPNPHVFVSGPYVVQFANYFRFPEYVNQAAVIPMTKKRTHVSSIIPPVFVRFSFQTQASYHTSAKGGYSSPPLLKNQTNAVQKTNRT